MKLLKSDCRFWVWFAEQSTLLDNPNLVNVFEGTENYQILL